MISKDVDYILKALTRSLQRSGRRASEFRERYEGKEESFTFHGGWNQGYWEGRQAALEDAVDLILEKYGFEED